MSCSQSRRSMKFWPRKYVIRSKWRKNQKRGAVPAAGRARAVIQMVLGSSPFLLALYASSSGCGRGVNLA